MPPTAFPGFCSGNSVAWLAGWLGWPGWPWWPPWWPPGSCMHIAQHLVSWLASSFPDLLIPILSSTTYNQFWEDPPDIFWPKVPSGISADLLPVHLHAEHRAHCTCTKSSKCTYIRLLESPCSFVSPSVMFVTPSNTHTYTPSNVYVGLLEYINVTNVTSNNPCVWEMFQRYNSQILRIGI